MGELEKGGERKPGGKVLGDFSMKRASTKLLGR